MDPVSPERWRQIERLLDAALDLPADRRADFLREAGADDDALIEQVARLLAAAEEPDARLDGGAEDLASSLLSHTLNAAGPGRPERIHRYLVVDEIGRGGMGVVYLAEDPELDRNVALKVARGGFQLDDRLLRRFHDERLILAALDHPNIARLLDGGLTDDGLPYFVMERVDGVPIDRYCDDGRLGIDDRLALFGQVCEAVRHAHTKGIVHRDLKPPNILVTPDGRVKLLDFGIAKLLVSDATGADDRTRTGHQLMTPEYASPEQVRGEAAAPASDVYSLGVLLYQLLTGRRPYRVTSSRPHELQRAVLEQQPTRPSVVLHRRRSTVSSETPVPTAAEIAQARSMTPDRLRRRLRGDLDAIVLKALEKNPGSRYSTAAEMEGDIRRHLDGLPVTARNDGRAYRTRKFLRRNRVQVAVAAAVFLLLALSTVATAVWTRRSARSVDGPARLALGRATKVTFEPGLELDPAISPDGRAIAYATGPQSAMRILLHVLEDDRRVFLTSAAEGHARNPRWSPDGAHIAYQAANSIWDVPVGGGEPRLLVEGRPDSPAAWMAWSPAGRQIAYLRDGAVWTRDIQGGEARRLAVLPEANGLAWSPDGRWIACASGNPAFLIGGEQQSGSVGIGNLAPSSIWIVPTGGGPPRRVTDDDHLDLSPVWIPDGDGLLYVSDRGGGRDVYAVAIDDDGRASGSPRRLTTGLQAHTIGLSADGRLLVYTSFTPTSNVYSIPIPRAEVVSSRESEPVTVGSRIVEGISVSPDGRWLAFDSDHLGNQDVFRMALPGGRPERLTTHQGDDFEPAWAPDGREIAYHSFQGSVRQIRLVSATGRDDRPAYAVTGHQNYPQWSPDGRRLTYHSWDTGEPHLFVLTRDPNVGWRAPEPLTAQPGEMAHWSPDGRTIAFVHRTALWTMDVESRVARPLFTSTDPDVEPVPVLPLWSGDGTRIYYKAFDARGQASIWSIPAEGGRPTLLVRFDDPTRQSSRPELASDGERFYFTLGSLESDVWTLELTSAPERS